MPGAAGSIAIGALDAPEERRAEQVAAAVGGAAAPRPRAGTSTAAAPVSPAGRAAIHEARGGAGRPLDTALRSAFELRLHADLGRVRLHDDSAAAHAAHRLGAQAWTLGQDIFFARGRYEPGAAQGRSLIAHELAHTLADDHHTVRRSPAEPSAGPSAAAEPGEPVEMPTDITEETMRLAGRTAEQIDDLVTRDWEDATQRQSQAMILASQVERILADVFERGYSFDIPQLRKQDAPVLQHFVGVHPGLRDRLAVLRRMAGDRNTERIGHYLAIEPGSAQAFSYQLWMGGGSAGRVVEGMLQEVRVRYLEDGKPVWTRDYAFVAIGIALPPGKKIDGGIAGDASWNDFYAGEYWAPEDFVGPMSLLSLSVGGAPKGSPMGPGREIEGTIIYGQGQHEPIQADIGGEIITTPDAGIGGFVGRLQMLPGFGPAPGPGHGVLPPAPPYVQRPVVYDQMTVQFATGESSLDDGDILELAAFVGRWRDVIDGGRYTLQLIGQASRTGSTSLNQRLSAERVASVRAVLADLIGTAWDDDKVSDTAIGEELARLEGRAQEDDSASDRVVEVSLVGREEREVGEP
jgi:outer membrane protein OmpA-like peptidoglycan-associated protein